jgi:hypothetical protein
MKSIPTASLDDLCFGCDHILSSLTHFKISAPERYDTLETYVLPRYFRILEEFDRRDETVLHQVYHILWTTLKTEDAK